MAHDGHDGYVLPEKAFVLVWSAASISVYRISCKRLPFTPPFLRDSSKVEDKTRQDQSSLVVNEFVPLIPAVGRHKTTA